MKKHRLVFTAGLLGCALMACSVSGKDVEDKIKSMMSEKGVTMKDVKCPATISGKAECSGTDDQGTEAKFDVTSDGTEFQIKLRGAYLDMKKLGDDMEERLSKQNGGKKVDVKCPSKTFIAKKGVKFNCDVDVDGHAAKIAFTCTDDEGAIDGKIE